MKNQKSGVKSDLCEVCAGRKNTKSFVRAPDLMNEILFVYLHSLRIFRLIIDISPKKIWYERVFIRISVFLLIFSD